MRLARFERRWLLTIFDAIAPGPDDGGLPVSGGDGAVGRFVDDLMVRAPLEPRIGLRAALWLVTLGPLVWRLRLRPFGRLPRAERTAFLDALAASRVYTLREIPTLMKMMLCMGLFALPSAQRALGAAAEDADRPAWAGPA